MSGRELTPICGWGRVQSVLAEELASEDLPEITRDVELTRGLGRSYGDASLPAATGARVAASRLANRLVSYQPQDGILRAEAGLSLVELNRLFLHRGWCCPVSPGTQFVTLGGMVAADVHGKNHHRHGSFGEHVQRLRLRVADGRIVDCSRSVHEELFRATIGGFGLTGHILEVELRLSRIPSPWIWQRVEHAPDLGALLERLREASAEWPYTVSWVDCFSRGRSFGRGVLILGRWAEPHEAPQSPPAGKPVIAVPFDCPGWLLSRWSGALFNSAYYRGQRPREGVVHPHSFFYPLDVIGHWNRVYGRAGFIQYQCVLPHSEGQLLVRRFMQRVAELGALSFLCVIKDFGAEGSGTISFPKAGFTVSLDIPYRRSWTESIVHRLNELVIDSAGRIYLAKDGLTRAEHFQAMEPRLPAWNRVRRIWDPASRLKSALSVRLLGDSA